MLNKDGQRELCYIAKVNKITPIEGADNIELAHVLGWTCIVKKDEFKEGDLGIYFEIDSKLPETEWSEFLANKHYKVKTMKLNKFKVISQGLLLPADALGWELTDTGQFAGDEQIIKTNDNKDTYFAEGDFLTKYLNVTYSVEEDNKRKSSGADKYKRMAGRHPKLFRNPVIKWIYQYKWGKRLLFIFFGKKKDGRNWPSEVKKTDEERIENRPWTLEDSEKIWIATEKIDGSSATYHLRRGKGLKKPEFFICSRNVVFDNPNKEDKNFYKDTIGNIWQEIDAKYDMQDKLQTLLDARPSAEWVTLQGEIFGAGVQKRDYGMKDHDIRAFNLIYSDCGRLPTLDMKKELDNLGIKSVPIISEGMTLPNNIDDLRAFVHSAPSAEDGKIKEGIVFRSLDGADSFKCVDPEFLLSFHQ